MTIEAGSMLAANETSNGAVLDIYGDRVLIKLAGSQTGGACSVMEDQTLPKCGPPLHRHSREEEWFYILEGDYIYEVDGKQIHATPGCFVHTPRGSAHTFQNIGDTLGRTLIFVKPAGLDDFFIDLDAAARSMAEPDMAVIVSVFEKHGLELLGPPIGARQ